MHKRKLDISIIIVHYGDYDILKQCLESIRSSDTKSSYEIIVVDNNEKKNKKIRTDYPYVNFIDTKKNVGYGTGINNGAAVAKGTYLYFLNPDTIIAKKSIDMLYTFAHRNNNVGMISPILLDKNKKAYALQGTRQLNPIRAIFSLSFINKLFPQMATTLYWIDNKSNKPYEVAVVPGTAMFIQKKLFFDIGCFDKNFFLYFEESDICKRLHDKGYKNYIIPSSKVIHMWGESTKKRENIKDIFQKSRFYYFKKHFGILRAVITEVLLRLDKVSFIFLLIILLAAFLRIYRIYELMIFFADQGWFYLSARNILVNHTFPLVSIPSSVTWLRQGVLSTYIIAFGLLIGSFVVWVPAVLFAILDLVAVYLVYKLGKRYYNAKLALLTATFYATSPLIVISSRTPYHTTAIPLLTVILYILVLKIKNSNKYLFGMIFFVNGLLLQLELSNVIIIPILILFFLVQKVRFTRKYVIASIVGFIAGIFPFILYDITNNFKQTVGFPLWVINRVRLFFGLTVSGNSTTSQTPNAILSIWQHISRIIFPSSQIVVILIIALLIFSLAKNYKSIMIKQNKFSIWQLVGFWIIISIIGFLIHAAPGDAYYPLLFIPLSLSVGFVFYRFQLLHPSFILFPLLLMGYNAYSIINSDYFLNSDRGTHVLQPGNYRYGIDLKHRLEAADYIVKDSKGKAFKLVSIGFISTISTGIDNYKYLIFSKGGVIQDNSCLEYVISEEKETIEKKYRITYYNNYVYVSKINRCEKK